MTERRRQEILKAVNVVRSITDKEMQELFGQKRKVSKPKERDISKLPDNEKELMITKLIIDLGIPASVYGYNYIREAVLISINEGCCQNVTTYMYPEIAKKYNTKTMAIERAIRKAFEISQKRGDLKVIKAVFGEEGIIPSNAQAISAIAEYLRIQQAQ